jgi:hypothetical protein
VGDEVCAAGDGDRPLEASAAIASSVSSLEEDEFDEDERNPDLEMLALVAERILALAPGRGDKKLSFVCRYPRCERDALADGSARIEDPGVETVDDTESWSESKSAFTPTPAAVAERAVAADSVQASDA